MKLSWSWATRLQPWCLSFAIALPGLAFAGAISTYSPGQSEIAIDPSRSAITVAFLLPWRNEKIAPELERMLQEEAPSVVLKAAQFDAFQDGSPNLAYKVVADLSGYIQCEAVIRFSFASFYIGQGILKIDRQHTVNCESKQLEFLIPAVDVESLVEDYLTDLIKKDLGATVRGGGDRAIDAEWLKDDPAWASFVQRGCAQLRYCKVCGKDALCFSVVWPEDFAFSKRVTALLAAVPKKKGRANAIAALRKADHFRAFSQTVALKRVVSLDVV